MTDKVEKVNYRIEFENDTAFATRSAIVVEIRDTLDEAMFDLSSYEPTGIKIGEKVEYLDGKQSFVKTMDMRPEINGLVEVEGNYEAQKGVMTWLFTSLDPMTMEPTNDPMQGFLPVNYNGTSGIGEISYNVKLKQRLTDGTEVPNRASIMFDINDFKSINDTYGHAEGDKALLIVADSLRAVIRRHNMPLFLARYGGDEFIYIVHPTEAGEVDALIRDLREQIADTCKARGAPYTLSIGAGCSQLGGDGDTFQACQQRADKNLYLDKAQMKSHRPRTAR